MKNIKLGISTSATQIESQDISSNWHDWANIKGNIIDGTHPKDTTNHYNLYQKDSKLLKELNISYYRMGIEWASIEPKENEYNETVIQHYISEIKDLKENNIQVMVCFHHFTNPTWFENKGGWLKKDNNIYFIDFVKKMLSHLKDLVSEYLTFNEPSIYAGQSYFLGIWPPQHCSFNEYLMVISNMATCHLVIYKYIKLLYKGKHTLISFAHSYALVRAYKHSLSGNIVSKTYSYFTNKIVLNAFMKGKFSLFLKNHNKIKKEQYTDFIALNYYAINFFKGTKPKNPSNYPLTDMDWLVYPEGIVICLKEMLKIMKLPVFITENGICDNKDAFRIRYIFEHLKALQDSKLVIERYYHWCFIDNFEWNSGLQKQFGLIKMDNYKERIIKKSGYFYSLLTQRELDDKKILEMVKDSNYIRFS
ncbi:MAG: family 1 glycosylhydrolase [Bacillales bacterium]|jgi:beta-glucosidase|nr:family 1 glycosylhydrolase [Bacillales bacterium]